MKYLLIAVIFLSFGCKKDKPRQVIKLCAFNHDAVVNITNGSHSLHQNDSIQIIIKESESQTFEVYSYTDSVFTLNGDYGLHRIKHYDFNLKVYSNGTRIIDQTGYEHKFKL